MVALEYVNRPDVMEVASNRTDTPPPMEPLTSDQNQKLIATYFPDKQDHFQGADFSGLQYLVGEENIGTTLQKYKDVITKEDIDDIQAFVTFAEKDYNDDIAQLQSFAKREAGGLTQDVILGFGEAQHLLWSKVGMEELPTVQLGEVAPTMRTVTMLDGTTLEVTKDPLGNEDIPYFRDYLKSFIGDSIEGKELTEQQQQVLGYHTHQFFVDAGNAILDSYKANPDSLQTVIQEQLIIPAKNVEQGISSLLDARANKYVEMHHTGLNYVQLSAEQQQKADEYAVKVFNNSDLTKSILYDAKNGNIDTLKYVGTGQDSNTYTKTEISNTDMQTLAKASKEIGERIDSLAPEAKLQFEAGIVAALQAELEEQQGKTVKETIRGGISSLKDFIAMIADILFDAGLLKEGGDTIRHRVRNERLQAQSALDTYEASGVSSLKKIVAPEPKPNEKNPEPMPVTDALKKIFDGTENQNIDAIMSSKMAGDAYTKKFGKQGVKHFMAAHIMQTLYGSNAKAELQKIVVEQKDGLIWKKNVPWGGIQNMYEQKMNQACGVTEEGMKNAQTIDKDLQADMLLSSLMKGSFMPARAQYQQALRAYKAQKSDLDGKEGSGIEQDKYVNPGAANNPDDTRGKEATTQATEVNE